MTSSASAKYSIKPSSGESVFEAYHSVFSYIMGDERVYLHLTALADSVYISKDGIEEEITASRPDVNIIFNDSGEETHYKFYNAENKKIYDPYKLCQIPRSHGNCLFYAFYLASRKINTPTVHNALFPEKLIKTRHFLTKQKYNGDKFLKVTEDKQLVYQCYVYNDYTIFKAILRILETNYELLEAFKKVWSTLSEKEKEERDIPLTNFTCDQYLSELNAIFNNSMKKTWQMTWDVVEIWDLSTDKYTPIENSGIEGATQGAIDKKNYKLSKEQLAELVHF